MNGRVFTERCGNHVVYVLESGDGTSRARVLPGYGFNCFSFEIDCGGRTFEILQADPRFAQDLPKASRNGTPVLFPFPNRIRAGRFRFAGREFELERNERGVNAIHGMVIDKPWRVSRPSGESAAEPIVVGEFQLHRDAPQLAECWPADFRIELSYQLDGRRLVSRLRVTNPDTRPLPWGFGTHPYYRLPLDPAGDESRCTVQVPATRLWALEELLPTGQRQPVDAARDLREARSLANLKLDDVYTGLQYTDGWCTSRLVDRVAGVEVRVRFDRLFREAVLYTPPARGAVCVEPYTCVTDAINLQARGVDAGLQVLAPGESVEGTIVTEVEPLNG
jgi:aldose 1-epimerase